MRRIAVVVVACAVAAAAAVACRQQDPLYCGLHGATDPRCPNFVGDAMPDGPNVLGYVSIGGTVLGLQGSATPLGLDNNGAEQLSVPATGSSGPISFVFPTLLLQDSTYDVTVYQQPTGPSQTCLVANGSGTATADVQSIAVNCTTDKFAVGGTVLGLNNGNTINLSLNGGANQPITGNGNASIPFTLGSLPSGSTYVVTPPTQTVNLQTCKVNASGTIGNSDITTVLVNCTNNISIGGNVNGLNGTVTLKNTTNSDTLMVSSNGTFTFPMLESVPASYNVTVTQNPTYPPAQQTCTVSAGSASNVTMDVTTIAVSCTTNTYTIGGSVSGVTGTLVLQDNGGDNKTITANGPFTFATAIASGNSYSVSVQSNPMGKVCTVTMGNGTVKAANITNVSVACVNAPDSGILCSSGTTCPVPTDNCCFDPSMGTGTCEVATASCSTGVVLSCDDAADCGGGMHVCCAEYTPTGLAGTTCVTDMASCKTGGNIKNVELWCDPNAMMPCPGMMKCMGTPMQSPDPLGYHKCM